MNTLEVTTIFGCSINCSYCPQDKLSNSYGSNHKILNVDDFNKIIKKLPMHIKIHFTGFSEPFFNAKCHEMINVCHLQNRYIKISTTLYKASEKNIQTILDGKFNKVILHLPANDNNMNIRITSDYLDKISTVSKCLTEKDSIVIFGREVNDTIKPLISSCKAHMSFLTLDYSNWNSRAGNIEYLSKIDNRRYNKIKCSKNKINQNVLLPNGDVYLCCMDWSLHHKLGNLITDSYDDVVNSKEYKFIIESLGNSNSNTLCWRCEHAIQDA